jgi:type II secretory pathway component PulF
MPRFVYAALDSTGQQTTGEVTASDSRQALARVRELGYFPTELKEAAIGPERILRGKVTQADIALSVRQLANLISAGLPVHRSLVVLTEQTDSPALRTLLEEARTEVRGGGSLSTALARFPKQFPPLAINLIRTGESTGSLDQSLQRLADLLEKSLQRRAQITSALIYPIVLIFVALAAVLFLVTFLIPKVGATLREFGSALPLPTIILMKFADAIISGWWAILGLLVILIVGFRYWWRRAEGRRQMEIWLRRSPMAGKLLDRIAAARFARTLGALLGGGVPILEGLEIAGVGAGSVLVSESLRQVREQVREGVPLATALDRAGGFLPALVHVSAVGEETGHLSELLLRLADSLDFEVDTALRRLISLLEPVIILVMGGLVGFIVLAILLPIFTLGSAMGR